MCHHGKMDKEYSGGHVLLQPKEPSFHSHDMISLEQLRRGRGGWKFNWPIIVSKDPSCSRSPRRYGNG